MTAHALKGDRERCLEAGMDAYLSKPIQPEQLRNIVEEMASTPGGRNRRTTEDAKPVQVLDGRALLAQVDGDVRLLAKLTRLFLADSPGRLSSIRRAIASQDARALQQAAHAFKGSIANFAARGPLEAAVALETMGRRNDLAGAEKAYLTLKKEVARLERALAAVGKRIGLTRIRPRSSNAVRSRVARSSQPSLQEHRPATGHYLNTRRETLRAPRTPRRRS